MKANQKVTLHSTRSYHDPSPAPPSPPGCPCATQWCQHAASSRSRTCCRPIHATARRTRWGWCLVQGPHGQLDTQVKNTQKRLSKTGLTVFHIYGPKVFYVGLRWTLWSFLILKSYQNHKSYANYHLLTVANIHRRCTKKVSRCHIFEFTENAVKREWTFIWGLQCYSHLAYLSSTLSDKWSKYQK